MAEENRADLPLPRVARSAVDDLAGAEALELKAAAASAAEMRQSLLGLAAAVHPVDLRLGDVLEAVGQIEWLNWDRRVGGEVTLDRVPVVLVIPDLLAVGADRQEALKTLHMVDRVLELLDLPSQRQLQGDHLNAAFSRAWSSS